MEDRTAIEQLPGLLAAGMLKIITADAVGADVPPTDPAHWIQHVAVALDGPNEKGVMIAHSAEGDWTAGKPAALLRRLTEWSVQREPVPVSEPE